MSVVTVEPSPTAVALLPAPSSALVPDLGERTRTPGRVHRAR